MAAHGLIASEAPGVGIRAEMDASEVYAELASRVSNPFLHKEAELLAKEELQHKPIIEEAYHRHFPEVPLALPHSQIPKQVSCKTDWERLSVKKGVTCTIEQERRTREFHFGAAQDATDLTGHRLELSLPEQFLAFCGRSMLF